MGDALRLEQHESDTIGLLLNDQYSSIENGTCPLIANMTLLGSLVYIGCSSLPGIKKIVVVTIVRADFINLTWLYAGLRRIPRGPDLQEKYCVPSSAVNGNVF